MNVDRKSLVRAVSKASALSLDRCLCGPCPTGPEREGGQTASAFGLWYWVVRSANPAFTI